LAWMLVSEGCPVRWLLGDAHADWTPEFQHSVKHLDRDFDLTQAAAIAERGVIVPPGGHPMPLPGNVTASLRMLFLSRKCQVSAEHEISAETGDKQHQH